MVSGISYALLNIDGKGRLHIPLEWRKRISLGNKVLVELGKKELLVKPIARIDDPIAFLPSLNIKTKKSPVEMKRQAELGFL